MEGAQLLIVGDGPARPSIERRARELGIAERVIITGRVPYNDMPDYVAAMDIAVIADERTGVASPMKLPEYIAMRRAVMAPRLPNIEDVLEEGVDGLLFTAGDREALKRTLQRLAADASLRRELGEAARRKVERERNWRRIAEVLLANVPRR